MAMTLVQIRAQFSDPMRMGLVDVLWQNSRVMRLLNFIQNAGFSYSYGENAKLPGVGFRNLNGTFPRTAGIINPKVETLSILGGAIRTDSVAIAVKGPGTRANEIMRQTIATAKAFDKNFFVGDPTTAGGGGKGFIGLKNRIAAGNTVTNATNGAAIDGNKVIALQNMVQGPNAEKVLLMNQTDKTNLVAWATDTADLNRGRYVEFKPDGTYFNGSRIEEVFYDETETAILGYTETCGSSSVTSSAYCVRFGGPVDEQDVQGISGLPGDIMVSGPFNYGEYSEDVCQMLAGIGVFGGHSAARLKGCTAT